MEVGHQFDGDVRPYGEIPRQEPRRPTHNWKFALDDSEWQKANTCGGKWIQADDHAVVRNYLS